MKLPALIKSEASKEGVQTGGVFSAFGAFASIALLNVSMGVTIDRWGEDRIWDVVVPVLILGATLVSMLIASIASSATHASMKPPTKKATLNYTHMAGAASGLSAAAISIVLITAAVPLIMRVIHGQTDDEKEGEGVLYATAKMVDDIARDGLRIVLGDNSILTIAETGEVNFVAFALGIAMSLAMVLYLVAGGLSAAVVFGAGTAESEGMIAN